MVTIAELHGCTQVKFRCMFDKVINLGRAMFTQKQKNINLVTFKIYTVNKAFYIEGSKYASNL